MNLEIDCPECGYNSYIIQELSTGNKFNAVVSKCEGGGCDLEYNGTYEHYEDFLELVSFFNNRFEILEITAKNCVIDWDQLPPYSETGL